jgi:hypothetical protein
VTVKRERERWRERKREREVKMSEKVQKRYDSREKRTDMSFTQLRRREEEMCAKKVIKINGKCMMFPDRK